ncbi:acetolactate decarboxylase [Reichenbachiella ulvae]|uniref:Acetolactate decarboxylase n=1 Tax=Reichenbachiella ulvae TaxID=2980104 RepID=A0ABT3CRE2_9BACT|nr:acetolactate decarboxylase [Reichenbachiella ulvae]MCV9386275.1 acetolactate decarboxylase [Reichenbachiella ulvae]
MNIKPIGLGLLTVGLIGCNWTPKEKNTDEAETYPDIKIVGAMKNVMRKGELGSSIDLDTISDKNGLYGLGPISYLTGELLINNGKSYVSKVNSDSTMSVEKNVKSSAPFFVYGNVTEWNEMDLPSYIKTIQDVEKFIDDKTSELKRPFAFKLIGQVSSAIIHIQNLPEGTKVSSPDEAHQGKINYNIANENAEIIGFFSTEHKGVFTHHDSFLHMHLITKDESSMGHLDELEIGEMKLYLPKK